MRNIPIFTAENGITSLILREIPYSRRAYVLVRSVWNGQAEALLRECALFCRAAGAEEVYASYELEPLPAAPAYSMLQMVCPAGMLPLPEQFVELQPVTADTLQDYRAIYNRCFRQLPGAAAYGQEDVQRLIDSGTGWLVRQDGLWAGVVETGAQTLEGIGILPEFRGLGYRTAVTALQPMRNGEIRLKVSDHNSSALRLYARMGFQRETILSRWWLVE